MNKIRWSLDKLVEKNKINKQESDKIYGRIKPIVDLKDALVDTDLLIEQFQRIPFSRKRFIQRWINLLKKVQFIHQIQALYQLVKYLN